MFLSGFMGCMNTFYTSKDVFQLPPCPCQNRHKEIGTYIFVIGENCAVAVPLITGKSPIQSLCFKYNLICLYPLSIGSICLRWIFYEFYKNMVYYFFVFIHIKHVYIILTIYNNCYNLCR